MQKPTQVTDETLSTYKTVVGKCNVKIKLPPENVILK